MTEPLISAKLYHHQADTMRALALQEADKKKRDTMLAIAEYYYLLHDEYVELDCLQAASKETPARLARLRSADAADC